MERETYQAVSITYSKARTFNYGEREIPEARVKAQYRGTKGYQSKNVSIQAWYNSNSCKYPMAQAKFTKRYLP